MKERNCEFDVIFAFAFGSPADLISNHNIAERVKKVYEDSGEMLPIMTQGDIAESLPLMYIRRHRKVFVVVDDHRIGYVSTLKFIKKSGRLAEENNWKKVLVIAAPMHAKRCVGDLRKMEFEAYEDKYLREKYSMSSIWWYHHNSTQFWTRSGLFWWPREIILRMLPWKIYEWISDRV